MKGMEKLSEFFAKDLGAHFNEKKAYLSLFARIGATVEDWIRGEILYLLSASPELELLASNQAVPGVEGKPDLVVVHNNETLSLELKALPKDRNYRYGWQRFCASPKNRIDFERLQSRKRDAVIYVYWSDENDWRRCKKHILEEFDVDCVNEFKIPLEQGVAVFSLWRPAKDRLPPQTKIG